MRLSVPTSLLVSGLKMTGVAVSITQGLLIQLRCMRGIYRHRATFGVSSAVNIRSIEGSRMLNGLMP